MKHGQTDKYPLLNKKSRGSKALRYSVSLFGWVLIVLYGCASLGPNAIKSERGNYNMAIQQTNDEQILLNLVRLKYRDTPIFLNINSISTQFSFEAGLESDAELIQNDSDIFGIGGSAVYSTRPTLTYSLLQGEEFTKRLLSPVRLDTIVFLSRSGWSFKRVLRLCVRIVGNLFGNWGEDLSSSPIGHWDDAVPADQWVSIGKGGRN